VWIESHSGSPSKPAWLVKRCRAYDCRSIFFAVSFFCAGVLSPSLSRWWTVFSGNHSGLCGDALEAVATPETGDRVETFCACFTISTARNVILPRFILPVYFWGGMEVNRFMAAFLFPLSSFCVYSCQTLLTWRWEPFLNPCCDSDHGKTRVELIRFRQGNGGKICGVATGSRAKPIACHETTSLGVLKNDKTPSGEGACVDAEPNPQCLNLVISPGAPL